MRIVIANSSSDPIYRQISTQIKNQILNGDLSEGEAIPSIRSLARDLRISVITTKRAYEELEREGFVDTVAGKGSFVSVQNPEFLREKRMKRVEDGLFAAIEEARMAGIGRKELAEMLDLLYDAERTEKED